MCLKVEDVELVAYTMRKIWSRRNSLLFEKKFDGPRNILKAARQSMNEFSRAQQLQQKDQLNRGKNREEFKWEKSADIGFKANWDAAVDVHAKKVGIGVIIRHSNGDLVAYLSSCVNHLMKPTAAEALALRRAAMLSRAGNLKCGIGRGLLGGSESSKQ